MEKYLPNGKTKVELPNTLTEIGDKAFYERTSLASIELPNSLTEIGGHFIIVRV